MMTAAKQFSLLRHPQYMIYWATRVSTTLAYQMMFVAIGWQVYDLTNSALDLGLVGLLLFIPSVPGTCWSAMWRIITTAAGSSASRRSARRSAPARSRSAASPAR